MARKIGILTAAIVVLVLAASPAIGARGGGKDPVATIAFAADDGTRIASANPKYGDSVWFAVDAAKVKERDLGSLWVMNVCYQDGVPVLRQDLGVDYLSYRQGISGAFTLGGSSWVSGDAMCTAFGYVFGEAPLPGVSFSYPVSG